MNQRIMNQVSIFDKPANNGVTMTSPEISELTGKRHDHILRDIRTMLLELHGEGGIPSFEDTHTNPQNGQSYPIFKLPKRETLILVSGYSVAMRAKIIDRWQELETKATAPALPDFNNPAAAARAWADAIELAQAKVIEVAQQNHDLLPALGEIDPVTGAEVNAHLTHPFSHGLDIAKVAQLSTTNTRRNAQQRLPVFQGCNPCVIVLGGLNNVHDLVVSHKTHFTPAHSLGYTAPVSAKKALIGFDSLKKFAATSRTRNVCGFFVGAPVMAALMGGLRPCRFSLREFPGLSTRQRCHPHLTVRGSFKTETLEANHG